MNNPLEFLFNSFGPFVDAFNGLYEWFNQPVGSTGHTIFTLMIGAGLAVYISYTIIAWIIDVLP